MILKERKFQQEIKRDLDLYNGVYQGIFSRITIRIQAKLPKSYSVITYLTTLHICGVCCSLTRHIHLKSLLFLQWKKHSCNEMEVNCSESHCGVRPKIKVRYYVLPWQNWEGF